MAHFASYVEALKREYESVYLVRNERQLMLYSFDSGERFEPGSPTSPGRRNSAGMEQDRILVVPKGVHLIAQDKWKEDFLLQIESRSTPRKTVADDNENYVRGFPFYNQLKQTQRFDETLNRVLPHGHNTSTSETLPRGFEAVLPFQKKKKPSGK